MQLDRLAPRAVPTELPGTDDLTSGVELSNALVLDGHAGAAAARGSGIRAWGVLFVLCAGLLGSGEPCRVDARFRSPSATLGTYWGALRTNDVQSVRDCFANPEEAVPFPGMLCFLPPCETLDVEAVQYSDMSASHLVATYEVRFRPSGGMGEMHVVTKNEMVKVRGAWRLVRAPGGVGMPEWRPIPRRVDI